MADIPTRLRDALAARYMIEREGGMATLYLAEGLKHEPMVAEPPRTQNAPADATSTGAFRSGPSWT